MEEKMEYKRKDWLCARCANQCKADGGMDYCEKFIDEEEAERTANAERIEELRKRCEEFMREVYAYVLSVQQKIDIFEKKQIKCGTENKGFF